MSYDKKMFKPILSQIKNSDIRKFADACMDEIPEYFWKIPASSTGKYHPQYALGEGGLARHTMALCRILSYILGLECYQEMISSRNADLMLVAGMMHDTCKSGKQEDFVKSHFTKFEHPLLAANLVRSIRGIIPDEEVEFCAHCIESHMGQWNTNSKNGEIVLPKPEDRFQMIVHLADYLASRKDIILEFNDYWVDVEPPKPPTAENWIIDFGKYRGYTFEQVKNADPDYIRWAKENLTREPAKSILEKM